MRTHKHGLFELCFTIGDVVAVVLANGGCLIGHVLTSSAGDDDGPNGVLWLRPIPDDNWPEIAEGIPVDIPSVEIAISSIVMMIQAKESESVNPDYNPGWIRGLPPAALELAFHVAPLKAFQTHWKENCK